MAEVYRSLPVSMNPTNLAAQRAKLAVMPPTVPGQVGIGAFEQGQTRQITGQDYTPPNVPGVPPSYTAPPRTTFPDVQATLNQPITNPLAGDAEGLDPVTKRMLDLIDRRTALARERAVSEASAAAVRRGIAGSSQEQFGIQQGIEGAERAGNEAIIPILRERLIANKEGELAALDADLRRRVALGQLTSDEVASIRNQAAFEKNLELQRELGLQGIQAGRENIEASKDIADQASRNQLIGAIAGPAVGAVLPSLLGKGIAGAGAGGLGAAGAGAGGLGAAGAAAGVAAGLGLYEESRKFLRKQGFSPTTSKVLGAIPGVGLSIGVLTKVSGDISKALTGGKTGVNVGDQQRDMNERYGAAVELRTAYQKGEISKEEYDHYIKPLVESSILLYHQTAGLGSKAANNIRQNFSQFVQGGFVNQTGEDSYVPNIDKNEVKRNVARIMA